MIHCLVVNDECCSVNKKAGSPRFFIDQLLPKASCYVALLILITFISWYTIPPLCDLLAHVSIGMLSFEGETGKVLAQYYHYQPSLTYQLLNNIIHVWTFLLPNNYANIVLVTYLSVLFLLISTIYGFFILLKKTYLHAFYLTVIMLGPVFLLLHSLAFILGLLPFILAVFMSVFSAVALWCLDKEIVDEQKMHNKTLGLFVVYTLLTIYSHPSGFLLLGINWIIPALRLVCIHQERKKRLFLWGWLAGIICYVFLFTMSFGRPLGQKNTWSALAVSTHTLSHMTDRLHWLITGGPYHLSRLNISMVDQGFFGLMITKILLTCVPLIIVCSLFFLVRKKDKNFPLLIIAQLIFAFILLMLLPKKVGQLNVLCYRYWIVLSSWSFMGVAYWLSKASENCFRRLCYCSPIFVILSCYLLMPLYAKFRQAPIENIARHYTQVLIHEVKIYRQAHHTDTDIVIDSNFHQHTMKVMGGEWLHYYLLPFLMFTSPALLEQRIIIRENWSNDAHLPISWTQQPIFSNTLCFHWGQETVHTIMLEPGKMHDDMCIPIWVKANNILPDLLGHQSGSIEPLVPVHTPMR